MRLVRRAVRHRELAQGGSGSAGSDGAPWLLCPCLRGGLPQAEHPLQHHDPAAQGRAPPDRGDPRGRLDADPVLRSMAAPMWPRRRTPRSHRRRTRCRSGSSSAGSGRPGLPARGVRPVRLSRVHHRPRRRDTGPWFRTSARRALRTAPWGSETRIRSRGGAVVLVDESTEQVQPANIARVDRDRDRNPGFGQR
jgi:hypothetical protein